MAKLTIEIDMDDPQEVWDALYQRIEDFDFSQLEEDGPAPVQTTLPATYDLLLDPDQVFGDAPSIAPSLFGIPTRRDES